MYVQHRFHLWEATKDALRSLTPQFGYNGFGEFIYYRTYSRTKKDGKQENWYDTILRVVEGTFSIRKDWYIKNHIEWDEDAWQEYARGFAEYAFKMYFLPPGRGLWIMGTDFIYQRGAMACYNCGYVELSDKFSDDFAWLMDSLMVGVGVGFGPLRNDSMELFSPKSSYDYIIDDNRESWVDSVRALLYSYQEPNQKKPRFIYDKIRPAGLPIKGFGGISSGPESLKILHEQIEGCCQSFKQVKGYDSVRFKTDVANMIGCCVVSGNVRRSAEISCAPINDKTFIDLKNYNKYPERQAYGWMSNNSCILENPEDYQCLGEIAKRVIENGEPGIINRKNFRYGRIGKFEDDCRIDYARAVNPCAEIPLEDKEVCNLSQVYPTVCPDLQHYYKACEYACFYSSTVSLLPTHQPVTNRVVARNRRIGVSIADIAKWKKEKGVYKVTRYLREGYKIVRESNNKFNAEAGVPAAIRCTTVVPGKCSAA